MRDEGRYNTNLLRNIGENIASTMTFMLEHWRFFAAVAAVVGVYLNRETEDEKKRKPELLDQIVATAEARCAPQTKYPELSPLKARLRDAVADVRSAAFDRFMNHKVTICPSQELPTFKNGVLLSNDFYAAYYYNNGEPVIAVWDKGKAKKDAGLLETKIDSQSKEALETFAQKFMHAGMPPNIDMLAYRESETYRCGDSRCTRYWIQWVPADKYASYLAKAPAMAAAPLKPNAPKVEYKTW